MKYKPTTIVPVIGVTRLAQVISGGQTGVDIAALKAARSLGFTTGGFAPKGFRTDTGLNPKLGSIYGLHECDSSNYLVRTEKNVRKSDATILLGFSGFKLGKGSKETVRLCHKYKKVCLQYLGIEEDLDLDSKKAAEIARSMKHDIQSTLPYMIQNLSGRKEYVKARDGGYILNFAGSRESSCPGITYIMRGLLTMLFKGFLKTGDDDGNYISD